MLFILVRHDFVLVRKSLLLQEIFDITFFSYLAFFIIGRLFYAIGEQRFDFLNLLRFFHIIRFPGILFLGGIMGFSGIIFLKFSKKKILARLFDIYFLSMYPLFIFTLFSSYSKGYYFFFEILIFILSCVFLGIGIYSYKNYTLKDGSIALLFLCLVSIFTIVSEFSKDARIIFSFFTIPQVGSIFVFLVLSTVLLLHEGMLGLWEK